MKALISGVVTDSAQETERQAGKLAQFLPENSILALFGSLGSGKTTFVRGMARHWEIEKHITSPTYNLVSIYRGKRNLVHLDAFRLEKESEYDELMIDDFLDPPFCLAIEWPQNIGSRLPEDCWKLQLKFRDHRHRYLKLHLPGAD